ncbi:MAG: exodeoxyribonuclease VII small subunit [Alphaproteobacteria bacterium]|nr:exodeoxyribonuclease VII small subunit [Alphaproteobacteria bacterium]
MAKRGDKTDEAPIEAMGFEAALAELEAVVDKLESGGVDLEAAIALYARGTALKQHCEAKLKTAQERIEKIALAADGSVAAKPAEIE